jgi:hypothetical protein
MTPRTLGPKWRHTYRDVDAVEDNLKKIVLEKNRVCESAKRQVFLKFGHFAPVVLMLRWFLCSRMYGK